MGFFTTTGVRRAKLPGSKKLVPVQQDLVDKVYDIAKEEGKMPYEFINDILYQSVRAHKLGKNLKQIVDEYELIETEKGSGSVIVSSDILYYMIRKLYSTDLEEIKRMYYERGEWYGNYLSAKFFGSGASDEPIEAVVQMLRFSLWDASSLEYKRKGEEISLSCIAPHLSKEGTELLASYIKGVFSALGFSSDQEELSRGIVKLGLVPAKRGHEDQG